MHLYLGGNWYECTRPIDPAAGPIDVLDVSVLQKTVLEGMLGITDPRGDARLQYLGGARPVADLEKLVNEGKIHGRVCHAAGPRGNSPCDRRCRGDHAAQVHVVRAKAAERACDPLVRVSGRSKPYPFIIFAGGGDMI